MRAHVVRGAGFRLGNNLNKYQPQVAKFSSDLRLRSSREFRFVFHRRASVADDTLVVYAAPNELGHCRLGLSVSRKVGNAVVRNRWKRLIREVFRQGCGDLPKGMDFVVVPRRGVKPSAKAIFASFPVLAERAARRANRRSQKNKS